MTTNERATILSVFADRNRADKAIDDLRHAGIGYNQIQMIERGAGNFLDNIKNLFTNQPIVSANKPNDLMKLGVPEQDAHYYQSQLDAGYTLLAVNATGRLEQALSILHQDGAHDINARLRTSEANIPARASQPAAARSGYANQNAPQGAYDPNAPQGPYNQNVPQEAYNNPNVPPQSPRV
jgi:hypothetical protein